MRPLGDRVLIKRDPMPENKQGSIILPDENPIVKVPCTGKVVSVGGDVTLVKQDDYVLFAQFSYQYFDKEQDLILVDEHDILGVIN